MPTSICIACGGRNVIKQMHRVSDIGWIRQATLEILQLDPNTYLTSKPYLCLNHFAEKDLVLLKSGRHRIRFGALPLKVYFFLIQFYL